MQMLGASWRSWFSQDFQRVGPGWLQYLWTLLFSLALAVPFTIVGFMTFGSGQGAWRNLSGWWFWYQKNLIVCLTIGFAIHLLFDAGVALIGRPRIRRFRVWEWVLFFAGIPTLGVTLAWPLGLWLAGLDVVRWLSPDNSNLLFGGALFSLLSTFALYQVFAAKAEQIAAEQRATEAQLKLLQGQIEPHFLFNTLANVVSLMEADTPRAKRMLESFVDYLRSSMGGLRHAHRTLGDEIDLVQAYLQVIAIRMDDRLSYRIDVPAELRGLPLPALMLQPLVENAIVHGLEPKIDGGHLAVAAHAQAGQLVLTVQDNGLGLTGPHGGSRSVGTGSALANIRTRLLQTYGSDATLTVASTEQPGVRACLSLPLPLLT